MENTKHTAAVDAWVSRNLKDLPREQAMVLFVQAFNGLWRRIQVTLGEVTLQAIVDRVLHDATKKFEALSSLVVESTGLHADNEVLERSRGLSTGEVAEGIRFMLVEFLTVLGTLTGEILTPALHADLGVMPISRPMNQETQKAGNDYGKDNRNSAH